MMKVNSVSIDLESFGAQFVNLDDNDQSAFFKGMAAEIRHWPSAHMADMQFCAIARLLSKEDLKTLGSVLQFISEDK